jgi:tRNA nucleotidyltransferase (CCA-adding enzyme)
MADSLSPWRFNKINTMKAQEHLEDVLKSQNLDDDSQELKDLQAHRKDVEKILREGFPKASPTIRYGGSKAKDTLIRESYDLDIVSYFPHDDTTAGDTLKDIFENVTKKLAEHYYVDPKTSAVRLKDKQNKIDFHIDVVPGRFVDDSKTDCFIYQNGADKDRLKTNLDVHINHVKNSGVVPAIRLLKLWKTRRGLQIKQFVFELLIIKLLKNKKNNDLDAQLKHVWSSFKEAEEPISVEDPANPTGNDLTKLLKTVWPELSVRSRDTLDLLERSGWEAIFGPLEDKSNGEGKTSSFARAAATVVTPTRPWLPNV